MTLQPLLLANETVLAIQKSWERAWMLFGSLPSARIRDDALMTWLITECNDPSLNSVLNSALVQDELVREIDAWIQLAQDTHIPVSWHVRNSDQSAFIETALTSKGFRLEETAIGMAMDLRIKTQLLKYPAKSNLNIVRVTQTSEIDLWVSILKEAYPMSDALANAMSFVVHGNESAVGEEHTHYLGILDNVPVASLTLSVWQDIASIYDVTTLPTARGNGVATAMTIASCIEAEKCGCETMVLQSSDMARNLYQKIGFQEYCTFQQYVFDQETLAPL